MQNKLRYELYVSPRRSTFLLGFQRILFDTVEAIYGDKASVCQMSLNRAALIVQETWIICPVAFCIRSSPSLSLNSSSLHSATPVRRLKFISATFHHVVLYCVVRRTSSAGKYSAFRRSTAKPIKFYAIRSLNIASLCGRSAPFDWQVETIAAIFWPSRLIIRVGRQVRLIEHRILPNTKGVTVWINACLCYSPRSNPSQTISASIPLNLPRLQLYLNSSLVC